MIDEKFKGLINFIVDILCLHLLCDEVGDDGVDPEVQLLDGLFSVLCASLCTLQPVQQNFNLHKINILQVMKNL